MERVRHQGGNDLSSYSEDQASRPQFTRTYDSLGPGAILITVMLKIVEDLGTRNYQTAGERNEEAGCSNGLPPYNLRESR